ncbi:MerR family transcriptional regulator [Actinacidiphila glaucinigra]|uniref:MerR family transcriptional regulator n=1 Tax=Streptomycetaceae TaxID=2062 RepID=UPI002DDB35B9|nr:MULTISPECIES: MerR family transcriptional regulator [Streptomycetaceae]WSD57476.1 MerR family transcriptional regulator [Actinacidiphila glaucinigra]WSD65169.1 MerR family transcriptional regulator [Actinacidiphila glaucinigra]WUB50258.1 MerR family transcriptional regulator [Streptomyces griseorubiginosus]
MRIKQLSERTGVSSRLLRYYEEQGLLRPRREENGYRDYEESQVARVEQIRSLLDAGLTTEIIRAVLPCLAEAANCQYPAPDFVSRVRQERSRMAERLACLAKNVQAIDDYLDRLPKSS